MSTSTSVPTAKATPPYGITDKEIMAALSRTVYPKDFYKGEGGSGRFYTYKGQVICTENKNRARGWVAHNLGQTVEELGGGVHTEQYFEFRDGKTRWWVLKCDYLTWVQYSEYAPYTIVAMGAFNQRPVTVENVTKLFDSFWYYANRGRYGQSVIRRTVEDEGAVIRYVAFTVLPSSIGLDGFELTLSRSVYTVDTSTGRVVVVSKRSRVRSITQLRSDSQH